ncbi:ERI1 exoribonuclease 3 [Tulasnella sp. JGI-2019a]|nr:ERI1 exoribonuclease 3 [Tulasnella sp. JGI-2019a]
MTTEQDLVYLLVPDFEVTCGRKGFPHPTLTEFCTELTGITQETVDNADTFPAVWKRFCEFLAEHKVTENPDSFAFLTCGDWDLKIMLPKQLKYEASVAPPTSPISTTLPSPFDRVINIKIAFGALYKLHSRRGMARMLRWLKLELEGRHHSGIDDCRNTARIVGKMLEDGWKPKVTEGSPAATKAVTRVSPPSSM